jgi:hypothetical protein
LAAASQKGELTGAETGLRPADAELQSRADQAARRARQPPTGRAFSKGSCSLGIWQQSV